MYDMVSMPFFAAEETSVCCFSDLHQPQLIQAQAHTPWSFGEQCNGPNVSTMPTDGYPKDIGCVQFKAYCSLVW
jgi:hypothetical protein